MNLHTYYNEEEHKTKYWIFCAKCGKRYRICVTPKGALKSAVSNGFDLDTGTCKVCHVMASMKALTEKRAAA